MFITKSKPASSCTARIAKVRRGGKKHLDVGQMRFPTDRIYWADTSGYEQIQRQLLKNNGMYWGRDGRLIIIIVV